MIRHSIAWPSLMECRFCLKPEAARRLAMRICSLIRSMPVT